MQMMSLDTTFGALSDVTRRGILERLARGEATVGELATPSGLSLPAFSRHLKVLERASLITNERRGKFRYCSLRREALSTAAGWLDFHRRFWIGSFDRLDRHLKKPARGRRA
jgi:DNA-binding transcriptional ArsR family regulator